MNRALIVDRDGAVERWTLNDPASRNALSDAMVVGLYAACLRAKNDPTLRGVVLAGAGGAFCAGGSLGGFAHAIGQPLQPGQTDPLIEVNRGFGDLLHALSSLPQWLLCAVDGPAMGGGFGLVCCADVVIATERASFATPEVTLGLPPAQIAPFVWRRLGDATARQCLLSGARWGAREAQAAGLVNRVVADGALDAAVAEATAALNRAAPGAVAATKQLLLRLSDDRPDLRDEAAIAFASALRGPEAAAGLAAFANKRAAPWAQEPPSTDAPKASRS
ncbi:MAG: enoyl-CoA hydratase/isomerase family protein [Hydrogenophaga sp.]|uniref:enoyl-CoA hydratase/isomerase family protein n=1 Tax=Hydrogenophaga sp. TaxID=1904254 RepID=UPI0016B18323|nr:enoyl-CoA hydratase/isomerase family protein [Hydrogenophaga sp.]NIM43011.1 enoyl-CoA hydratase/isomerase family protein [Hydrogenophaga sp.]NIN28079.1 enoyl-CoA hydratase/isomerase family protein [Hydrogenophaga sp.]NIN30517.1 enoyl-CoA hydratase/isomerase family protein [Hydrogenophaga sp.]NIN57214.1 enoyl-CoA hydratase/isomerase family protein [Hydrogenophaga sp.]NIO51433.1 enoyl-CoA hydratase/isomerase family protein [Hydrogenophaga sp.]